MAPPSPRVSKELQLEDDIRFTVLESIQKAIVTTACHASKRTALLKLLISPSTTASPFPVEHHRRVAIACIREVALNRLPLNTPPDSLKRYTTFMMELCKQYTREMKSTYHEDNDDLPITIIEGLVDYHNAKDKNVRLMVVTLINVLLGTLCDTVQRESLYITISSALKERSFDKCPLVREKAVSGLRAFHVGDKTDDITQVCLAVMCEDPNPKVREAAVLCPSRYRSVHLRHTIRLTRDVNSSVRRASWEALSSYNLKTQLISYAQQLRIDIISVVAAGFEDSAEAVKSACKLALSSWLTSSFKGDVAAMVDGLFSIPVTISQPAAETVISHLISIRKGEWSPMGINTACIGAANITLWKCSVRYFLDENKEGGGFRGDADDDELGGGDAAGGGRGSGKFLTSDDDSCGLPILPKFNIILTAAVNRYTGRPTAPPKDGRGSGLKSALQPHEVIIGEREDTQYIVDVLLSAFGVYADLGLLGHADDSGRAQLMRPLSFLLKVVTIDKPTCFVDASVKTIVDICVRHEGEGMTSVESSLKMLFSLLSIPKKYELSYEDVEAFGRYDFDRRRRVAVLESHRLRDGMERDENSEEHVLIEDIATDDAVLLRMCRIVHAYLSYSRRGVTLPAFISHVVHLARSQSNVAAKSLAMKCLTLQCLINPQMVMTFLPIFLQEALSGTQVDVVTSAIGGIFDMINEYGNKFFDNNGSGPPPPGKGGDVINNGDDGVEEAAAASTRRTKDEERRRELERLVAKEDTHKPGSQVLTRQLISLLQSPTEEIRYAASFGFCRLLAANRLLPEAAPLVLARLLLFLVGTDNNSSKCSEPTTLQMHRIVETFFRSYAFSHHKRQVAVLEGGLLALRMTLDEFFVRGASISGDQNSAPKIALKILKKVIQLTDAINTQQVRDVDPELSARMALETAAEVARLSGSNSNGLASNASVAALNEATSVKGSSVAPSGRSAVSARGATLRLWRELGKHSLHERLCLELLTEATRYRDSDAIVKLCLDDLSVMRLYKRDGNLYKTLASHVDACCAALRAGPSCRSDDYVAVLEDFLQGAAKINAPPIEGTDLGIFAQAEDDSPTSVMRLPLEARLASRNALVQVAKTILLVTETPATASESAHRESLLMGRSSTGASVIPSSGTPETAPAPLFFDSPATEASLSQSSTPVSHAAPSQSQRGGRGGGAARGRGSRGGTTSTTAAVSDSEISALLKNTVSKKRR